jgi:hypothetical protein
MNRRSAGLALAAAIALSLIVEACVAQTHTICEVQAYNAQGLSPLFTSPPTVVTVKGVVTLPPGYIQPTRINMYIELDGCGVNVYSGAVTPAALGLALGDTVLVTGTVIEYISGSGAGATTEIEMTAAEDVELIAHGPAPEPTYFNLQEAGSEEHEGRLIRTIGVIRETNYDWRMYIEQPWSGAEIQIYQGNNDSTDFSGFDIGDTLDVTGVVMQYDTTPPYFDGWELVPRFQTDIKLAVPPEPGPPAYFPNASLQVPALPFRPEVGEVIEISYSAPEGSEVAMEIYDLQGRKVRTLTRGPYDGQSDIPDLYKDDFFVEGVRGWDGRDDLRRLVPAGIYLCRLEAKDREGKVSATTAPIVVGVKLD